MQRGAKPPKMNSQVSALRFFLKITLGRFDLAHALARVDYPRKMPRVLPVADARGDTPGRASSTRQR